MVAENGDVPQHNGLAALRTATFSFQLNIHKPLRSPIWYRELDDIIFNRFDDLVHGPYPTAALVAARFPQESSAQTSGQRACMEQGIARLQHLHSDSSPPRVDTRVCVLYDLETGVLERTHFVVAIAPDNTTQTVEPDGWRDWHIPRNELEYMRSPRVSKTRWPPGQDRTRKSCPVATEPGSRTSTRDPTPSFSFLFCQKKIEKNAQCFGNPL